MNFKLSLRSRAERETFRLAAGLALQCSAALSRVGQHLRPKPSCALTATVSPQFQVALGVLAIRVIPLCGFDLDESFEGLQSAAN